MGRRAVTVFFCFMFLMGVSILRIFMLITGEYAQIGSMNSTMSVDVGTSRGYIFDCNMRPLVNSETEYIAVASPTENAVSALRGLLDDKSFTAAYERLQKGYPATVTIPRDTDCGDITVIKSIVRYSENQTAPHIIGYINGYREAVSGLEKSFDDILTDGNRTCSVRFSADADGRVLGGEGVSVEYNDYYSKQGICLTIDKNIQKIVEEVTEEKQLDCGAVVVTDVETGEIKAISSLPAFDVTNVASSLDDEKSPLFNRSLNAFSVGSVFKIIVASAALENGVLPNLEYDCTGNITKSGVIFNCHERSGHGLLDMREGIRNSCNTYFINLAMQFDVSEIIELSYYMGLGTSLELAPGIKSNSGILPEAESLDSDASVANIAFGQGKLLATPLQIAAMTSVIASGGFYREPYLIKGYTDKSGTLTDEHGEAFAQRVISERTAEMMREFLNYTAEMSGNGMPKLTTSGGKTATSQSGVYKNGIEQLNTWYSGFFPADSPKYVITVLKESGASGAYDCQPVFNAIADRIFAERLFYQN